MESEASISHLLEEHIVKGVPDSDDFLTESLQFMRSIEIPMTPSSQGDEQHALNNLSNTVASEEASEPAVFPVLTRPPRPQTVEHASNRVDAFHSLLAHNTDSISDSQMSQITSKYEQLEGSVENLKKSMPNPETVAGLISGLAEIRIAQSQLATEMKTHQRETDAKLKSIIAGLQALASGGDAVSGRQVGPIITDSARAEALGNIVRAAAVPLPSHAREESGDAPVAVAPRRRMRIL